MNQSRQIVDLVGLPALRQDGRVRICDLSNVYDGEQTEHPAQDSFQPTFHDALPWSASQAPRAVRRAPAPRALPIELMQLADAAPGSVDAPGWVLPLA